MFATGHNVIVILPFVNKFSEERQALALTDEVVSPLKKLIIPLDSANIGPRSGPGTGKKASYGSGKQTLRLRANGPAEVEETDDVRWEIDGYIYLYR